MNHWILDLRFAVRQLKRSVSFTVAAILTLSLGIGALTAIFTVANTVLVKPLPYRDPERLDLIRVSLGEAREVPSISEPELFDLRDQSELYEGFAGLWVGSSILSVDGETEQITAGWSTANLFALLGIDPMVGRHFEAAEEVRGGPEAIILSHGLWQSHFGGDPGIVGSPVKMRRTERTVVGVLPPDFQVFIRRIGSFSKTPVVWQPISFRGSRDRHWLRVVGRRKPGVELEQAQAELDAIARRLAAEYPEYATSGLEFHVVSLHGDLVKEVRPALVTLVGTAAFLLLIACANVASMMLARSGARGGEMAVRAALGAGRFHLMRQLLTESAVLAVLGGVLGLILARLGLALLLVLRPAQLPRLDEITIDLQVLAVAAVTSLLTLVVFGLYAAVHASRLDLNSHLRESGRSLPGHQDGKLNFIVVAEVALALALLIATGLMVRTFASLRQVELGFVPDSVLSLRLSLPTRTAGYETYEERSAFLLRATDAIRNVPGVTAVGGTTRLPFGGSSVTGHYAYDATTELSFENREASYRWLLPGFFDAVKARLVSGRALSADDVLSGRLVVVVDESLARLAWPGGNALGQRVKAGFDDPEWYEVVGVVEHIRHTELRSHEPPQIYFPFVGTSEAQLTVQTRNDPMALAPAIRGAVRRLDPAVPVSELRPFDEIVGDAMADVRFVLVLMGVFAATALVLAAVGIYAVLSFWVGQRLPDIGVRMAMGATRRDVLVLVLRHGLLLSVVGLVVGLLASAGLTRTLESLLFNVTATDPVTFLVLTLLLLLIAMAACLIPALRAVRVDPVTILRHE